MTVSEIMSCDHKPKRVRIFFINCPNLDKDAAAFIILAQNRVQKYIEFEIIHFWIYALASKEDQHNNFGLGLPFRISAVCQKIFTRRTAKAERNKIADLEMNVAPIFRNSFKHPEEWSIALTKTVEDYDQWYASSGYDEYDVMPCPAIVITETAIDRNYLSLGGEKVSLISLALWKDIFSPISALEYVLVGVQRQALRMCYKNRIGSHYPTRGCLWDFDVNQSDLKIAASLGFLCSTCRDALSEIVTKDEKESLDNLIANEWIGKEDDNFSVSGILAKQYRYPIFKATGLRKGVALSIVESMKTDLGKLILDILKWVIIFSLSLLIVHYFPGAVKALKLGD
jgi:hypothetical protein